MECFTGFSSGHGTLKDKIGAFNGVISLIFSIMTKIVIESVTFRSVSPSEKATEIIVPIFVQNCHSSNWHSITKHTRWVFLTLAIVSVVKESGITDFMVR
jgi:hypothetical protein